MAISAAYGRKTLQKIAQKASVKDRLLHRAAQLPTNYLREKSLNLQQIMGHSNIATTMMYVHISEEDTEEELTKLSSLYQKIRK